MGVGYRWVSIVAAIAAAWGSGFSIYFVITALVKYRAEDFFLATKTTDFTTKGTCVEVASQKQLEVEKYDHATQKCSKGRKKRFRKSLEVSIHGIYHAYVNEGITNHAMERVARVALGSVAVGGSATMPSLNYSIVYEALTQVAALTVPTSCDTIYEYTENVVSDSFLALLYENKAATWPLNTINIRCNDADEPEGIGDDWAAAPPWPDTDPAVDMAVRKQRLYTHCVAQFRYASVGIEPNSGTFGIPSLRTKPGPDPDYFYPTADGFSDLDNSIGNYTTKARVFQGQRFGYSVWAYVPMILASCFLAADAVVYVLAEATFPAIIREMKGVSTSQLALIRDGLVIIATSKAARAVRFTFGFLAVFCSALFWGLYIVMPWGLFETRMPRPICETGKPDHVFTLFWSGSNGGWKKDWDAGWYEFATILTQFAVLLLLPITSTNLFRACNSRNKTNDERITNGKLIRKGFAGTTLKFRRSMRIFFVILVIGGAGWIAGQSVSGARFGMAWAEGVVGRVQTTNTDGTVTDTFNEVLLAEAVYSQTIATLMITIVVGLVTGAAAQRHLLTGAGCFSATIFFAWICLIFVFIGPLLVYSNTRSITSKSKANEDCSLFPSDYKFARGACEARFWSFLIAGGVVLGTLLLMTIIGLLEAFPKLFKVKNKAQVEALSVGGLHEKMVEQIEEQSRAGDDALVSELGGYRSSDEKFFNFSTNVGNAREESQRLLYAPHFNLKLPKAGGVAMQR